MTDVLPAVAVAVLLLTAGCMSPLAGGQDSPTTDSTAETSTWSLPTTTASTTTAPTTTSRTSTTPAPDEPTVSYVQWRELPSPLSSVKVRHEGNETTVTQELNPHNGSLRLHVYQSLDGEIDTIKRPRNFTAHYVEKGEIVAYIQNQNDSRKLLLAGIVTEDGAEWFPSSGPEFDNVSRETARQEADNLSVRFRPPQDPQNDYRVETEGVPENAQILLEDWSTVGKGEDWFVHASDPSADSRTLVEDDYIRVYYAHGDERVYLGTYDPHNATDATDEY